MLTDAGVEAAPSTVLDELAAAVGLDEGRPTADPTAVDEGLTAAAVAAADAHIADPAPPDLASATEAVLPDSASAAVEPTAAGDDEHGLTAAAETRPGAAHDDLAISLAVRDEQELVRLLNEIEAEDAAPPPLPAAPEPPPAPAVDEGETFIIATATLAEIYLQQGLAQRAMETYRQVLAHNPANEAARQRLAELEQSART